jgi:hypothetical protein
VVCVQETKLSLLSPKKKRVFLPPSLTECATIAADGSRGGISTAWDPRVLSLTSSIGKTFSLTTVFSSTTTATSLTVTNVYTPSDHSRTPVFTAEMIDLSPSVTGPWLILGDFNLIRKPCEKNTPRFDCNLAAAFNSMIQSMALFELPLLDRLFTWTNGQDPPILARLDRAFFNHDWNNAFPTSSLTTLPRPTSDHFPLLVTARSSIPHTAHFRFENAWLVDPAFLPTTMPAWTVVVPARNAAAVIAAKANAFGPPPRFGKGSTALIPS